MVGRIPAISWRRKWQPTPVFVTGTFHRGAWWAKVHELAKSQTGPRTSSVCVCSQNEVGLLLQEKLLPVFVADDNSSRGHKESPKKKKEEEEEGKTVHCMY